MNKLVLRRHPLFTVFVFAFCFSLFILGTSLSVSAQTSANTALQQCINSAGANESAVASCHAQYSATNSGTTVSGVVSAYDRCRLALGASASETAIQACIASGTGATPSSVTTVSGVVSAHDRCRLALGASASETAIQACIASGTGATPSTNTINLTREGYTQTSTSSNGQTNDSSDSISSAQDTGTSVINYCPHLTITMQKCDPNHPLLQQKCTDATTDGQVTELQTFLSDYYDLNPDDYVTGYFGRLTRDNVRRFQCEQMGICSGDEATTGWGVVGPLTRAAIARVCGHYGNYTGDTVVNTVPPLPTCILNVNPSSITLGQSSLLSWSSTNASGGTISSIGTVSANGSQTVSPAVTTTYNGYFWGMGGSAQCSATLSVTRETTTHAPCTFNNQSVPDGQSVTAYQAATVPAGTQCLSQQRTCTNGTLSGSYQYDRCSVATATCTPEQPQTQTLNCPTGQTGGITQTRTSVCVSGATAPTWTDWVTTNNTCGTNICTPEAAQTRTLSCPMGQTGSITQTRTSICATGAAAPTWGEWTTRSNTCVATDASNNTSAPCPLDGVTVLSGQSGTFYSASTVQSPNTCSAVSQVRTCTNGVLSGSSSYNKASCSVTQPPTTTASRPRSCTYNGISYPDGSTQTLSVVSAATHIATATCEDGYWYEVGLNRDLCEDYSFNPQTTAWDTRSQAYTALGCEPQTPLTKYDTILGVRPTYGAASLSTKAYITWQISTASTSATLSWGDSSSLETVRGPTYYGMPVASSTAGIRAHTYAAPGTYTITVNANLGSYNMSHGHGDVQTRTKTVTVTGTTASAAQNSQLANALTALESVLKALLQLLK